MLAQALIHTISHLTESEKKERRKYGREKSAQTDLLHLSHLYRITHAHSPATFALFLFLSLSAGCILLINAKPQIHATR